MRLLCPVTSILTEMTDKKQFIHDWLKDNPNDDRSDAVDAWKGEVKFANQ